MGHHSFDGRRAPAGRSWADAAARCATRTWTMFGPLLTTAAAVALASAAAAADLGGDVGPHSGDTFVVETNPYLIGQAPDWLDDTHVSGRTR